MSDSSGKPRSWCTAEVTACHIFVAELVEGCVNVCDVNTASFPLLCVCEPATSCREVVPSLLYGQLQG